MQNTILVVDDEPEFVDLMSWTFQSAGYRVESASTGTEALDKAQTTHPAAIILDLMLPELDGRAVCEILRQVPATAAIPILMVTGCASDQCRGIALSAGVNDYITKPCSPRELVSRVGAAIKASSEGPSHPLDETSW